MIKLNNGAICDHDWSRKDIVMCATAQEMKQQNGTQTYDND
jgi:hypothetical protein